MQGPGDIDNDGAVGFQIIATDDIDDLGIPEIVKRIRTRVGDSPVYLRCVQLHILRSGFTINHASIQPGYRRH